MLKITGLILACALAACGSAPPPLSPSANTPSGYADTPAADALYDTLDHWLCHPSLADDADLCRAPLDTTAVHADGRAERWPHRPAESPAIDCFYVYPTTSVDLRINADLQPDAQERITTQQQAGRYSEACRVFAPLYRQRTLPALILAQVTHPLGLDLTPHAADVAYADVLAAWRHYLRTSDPQRGVLLIGHSQGATLLRRLIAEAIEPEPDPHSRLVAAHLLGSAVTVPIGADVGGSFARTPACRAPDDWGCVVSYAAYRAGDPRLDAPRFGVTSEQSTEALCTHPAALAGGAAELDARLPLTLAPLFQRLLRPRGSGGPYADPDANRALDTAYFAVPQQLSAECRRTANGAHYLEVRIAVDPQGLRADDYPGEFFGGRRWGLHLADVNLAQGDLVRLARHQASAWQAARPSLPP